MRRMKININFGFIECLYCKKGVNKRRKKQRFCSNACRANYHSSKGKGKV